VEKLTQPLRDAVKLPSAAVGFLGAEHPLVRAVLTVLGRMPKG
jgi:hypothetical protein